MERELQEYKSKLGSVDNSLASKLQLAEKRIRELEQELESMRGKWKQDQQRIKDLEN